MEKYKIIITLTFTSIITCIYLCFFLISAKIWMFSAPICFLYRSRLPAQAFIIPSSATWENTNPSARIKSRPAEKQHQNNPLPKTEAWKAEIIN